MRTLKTVPTDSPVDGVHYSVTGEAEHAIVLLHGFADNAATWNRVVPPLAVNHKVIAIDLPGFGNSTKPWSRPLLPGYIEVVRAVLAAEDVGGPVSLMGNSMGAVVSLLFAAQHPECADGIVLIDMPALRTVPRLWRLAMSRPAELALRTGLRALPDGTAQFGLGWIYTHLAAANPRRLDPLVREGFASPYALRERAASILPLGRALLDELRTAELGALVATTGVPTLLVFGSRDLLTPARVLRRVGRPGGAVVLPACGHCPQVDRPADLLEAVLPFLRDAIAEQDAVRSA
jgi:pimeloyl-ACP methyl ester carboxylesterase